MGVFYMFWALSTLTYFDCRNSTIVMITEIGVKQGYNPKWYITPQRLVKKLFKLKESIVHKYLYFELYIAILFGLLFPINSLIYLCTNGSKIIAGVLLITHLCLGYANKIYFWIVSCILKRQ